ncbi:hypothetical protein TRFO_21520 [Tritrichomonas foetus]|uniref:AB hydrolase-1 domain-containing protein n=1 Tax=Tritrichomonas foetus TaxID=1144522 RepID=A0A1J4KEW0_9EUKA|nr:hypothetical protein TRFO_21520 [Tritrichomonas foetus]|eukprot:OHT09562.1 hypothetical protein TRFO_21520 [Tritrichomonas foetus]
MSTTETKTKPPVDLPTHGDKNPLFVFCHGYYGCGTNCWFPFAHTTVANQDCDFVSPDCPNPTNPRYQEWKVTLLDSIKRKWNKTQPLILVGHSLGCYTLLRILIESISDDWAKHVRGFFFVAPVVVPKILPDSLGLPELELEKLFELNNIKYHHLFCTNDGALGSKHSEYLRKVLTDGKSDYKCLELPQVPYDSHFGGFKHYPVKEIDQCLIELIQEIKHE